MAEQGNMSFLDHIGAMRRHLMRASVGVLIGMIIAFAGRELLIDQLLLAPKEDSFITYQWFCQVAEAWSLPALCIEGLEVPLLNSKMAGQFTLHIWISLLAGVILAFPWILWQIWLFIAPGLKSNERRHAVGFITFSSLLMFIGAIFGYFLIVPLSLRFLGNYVLSTNIQNLIETSSYLNTVMSIILSTGIMFELPMFMYFLTRMGVSSPEGMKKYRRHAYIGILGLSAVITPPDVFSQILVSLPVFLLYEFSILVSRRVVRRRNK